MCKKFLCLTFFLAFCTVAMATDIAFYVGQWNTDGWYDASQFDDVATIIAETGHLFNDIQQFDDDQLTEFGEWVDERMDDGVTDIIWLNGSMPSVLYPLANASPDGSRAEGWLDGGNMFINVGDWFAYCTYEGGTRGGPGAAADNGAAGAGNILDLSSGIIVSDDSGPNFAATPTAKLYVPSLDDPSRSVRPVVLSEVQDPWEVAFILASPGGSEDPAVAQRAEPVVLHNTETGGYVAIVNQASTTCCGNVGWLSDRGKVVAELIGNWVTTVVDFDAKPVRKAREPDPPDGAEGVVAPLVSWKPGGTAQWHDVYFGTTPDLGPDDFRMRNQKAMTMYWHIPGLVPGITYYWRIDEVEADAVTIHTGDVWSFTALGQKAWKPNPLDGAEHLPLEAVELTWNEGQNAVEHHVYFADSFDDVNDGAATADKGTVDTASYIVENLEVETTYYWRVDEEDDAGTVHKDDVWSFTTVARGPGKVMREWWLGISGTVLDDLKNHPRYPDDPDDREFVDLFEGPVDWADNYGSRLRGWLYPPESASYTFWIATDDQGELWLSTDEDPANAVLVASVSGWVPSRDFDGAGGDPGTNLMSSPIALEAGKRYYMEGLMKEGGGGDNIAVAWQGGPISSREVLSGEYVGATPYPPVRAYGPVPLDGATDVPDTVTLQWSPGTYAVQHDVYLGTDADAVANADTTTTGIYRGRQNTTSFSPGLLPWNTTHYWRIDEVNPTHPDSPWAGEVWSFTTANYILVDGFEDYNDYTPDRIWQTWRDGYGYNEPPPGYAGNGTGSQVGNDDSPFTERTIVHSDAQAMTFRYTNDGSTLKALYSEVEREWAVPQNWTRNGVKALSLWFYGDAANSAERLYVGVQDSLGTRKDVPHPSLNALLLGGWQEFNIDLQEFANAGVNLTSVKKMYLGVGNRLSPQTGGTGRLYFDDIRLYKPRCLPSLAKPDAELSGDCVVDYADLQILTDEWLGTGYLVTPDDPGTNGLAGYWRFDGNANDASGNGRNGTPMGMPTYTAGKFGQAIRFDGVDDYVVIGAVGISGAAPRTISGWAKIHTLGWPNWVDVFGFTGPSGAGGHFDIELVGTTTTPGHTTYGYYGIHVYGWEQDIVEADSDWHHLAASYDGTMVRWYGDGRLIGSGVRDVNTPDNVHMGKRDDNENYFPGSVDEVRIYNRVLSDGEVASLGGLTEPYSQPFDLNVDGVVDFRDYAILAAAWLEEVLWP